VSLSGSVFTYCLRLAANRRTRKKPRASGRTAQDCIRPRGINADDQTHHVGFDTEHRPRGLQYVTKVANVTYRTEGPSGLNVGVRLYARGSLGRHLRRHP
jgi:hypothetical protein